MLLRLLLALGLLVGTTACRHDIDTPAASDDAAIDAPALACSDTLEGVRDAQLLSLPGGPTYLVATNSDKSLDVYLVEDLRLVPGTDWTRIREQQADVKALALTAANDEVYGLIARERLLHPKRWGQPSRSPSTALLRR